MKHGKYKKRKKNKKRKEKKEKNHVKRKNIEYNIEILNQLRNSRHI
jgi:hypothetical protein